MSKKKLPPSPPSDDPVLRAIKEAHKRPLATFTSAETEALCEPQHKALRERLRPTKGMIERHDTQSLIRRGKRVWRPAHGTGADLDRPPVVVAVDRAEQQYEIERNKLARAGRWFSMQPEASAKGIAERRSRAVSKADVRAFAKQHTVKETAKQFLITPRHVRQILDEEKGK
jgi:hypothetical protein